MSDLQLELSLGDLLRSLKQKLHRYSLAFGNQAIVDLVSEQQTYDQTVGILRRLVALLKDQSLRKDFLQSREISAQLLQTATLKRALGDSVRIAAKRACSVSQLRFAVRLKHAFVPLGFDVIAEEGILIMNETVVIEFNEEQQRVTSVQRVLSKTDAPSLGSVIANELSPAIAAVDAEALQKLLAPAVSLNQLNSQVPGTLQRLHSLEEDLLNETRAASVGHIEDGYGVAVRTCSGIRLRYYATPSAIASGALAIESLVAGAHEGAHDVIISIETFRAASPALPSSTVFVLHLEPAVPMPIAQLISIQKSAAVVSHEPVFLPHAMKLTQLYDGLPSTSITVETSVTSQPSVLVDTLHLAENQRLPSVIAELRRCIVFNALYKSCFHTQPSDGVPLRIAAVAPRNLTLTVGGLHIALDILPNGSLACNDKSASSQAEQVKALLGSTLDVAHSIGDILRVARGQQ